MSRVIAFDHGTRRIGVAVADSEIGQAFSRPALRAPRGGDIGSVVALARAERAELVVVGLPRNMDGSEGAQAAAARRFGDQMAADWGGGGGSGGGSTQTASIGGGGGWDEEENF